MGGSEYISFLTDHRSLNHSPGSSSPFIAFSQSRCKRYVQSSSGKLCFNVGILGTVEVIFHDPNVLLLAMITIIFSPVISVVWFAFPCKIVRDVRGFNIERRKYISDKRTWKSGFFHASFCWIWWLFRFCFSNKKICQNSPSLHTVCKSRPIRTYTRQIEFLDFLFRLCIFVSFKPFYQGRI